jgi:alkaline phosphatase D
MRRNLILAALMMSITSFSFGQDVNDRSGLIPALAPFYHGVASGDPLADKVVLWTRVTPDSTVLSTDSIQVNWRVATDTAMSNVVTSGMGYTNEAKDWTFKIDASGLSADGCYYYDFYSLNKYSVRGRTFTAPVGDIDSLRFAVVSCSNYEHGYFNAYARLLQRNDFSAVLHLGDYIYEYEAGGYSANIAGRDNAPTNEIISLTDYRVRHSHYKLDDDLRMLHQQYPFITIWDDHESANDSYKDGAENHSEGPEGLWVDRKAYSMQAYHEWMPIRTAPGSGSIYRTIEYGDLAKFYMCDTRLEGRTEQSAGSNDSTRTILGTAQYNWLVNELDNSSAQWNIMGQQVMMAPLEIFGTPVNNDQWDGYNWERTKLQDHIVNNNIENFVVLTGDIHTSWANDLPGSGYDASTGAGSVGVEFVVTSVTSPGLPLSVPASTIQLENDHMQYIDLTEHGYMILDINKQRTQADWYYLSDITTPSTSDYYADGWYVNSNERNLNHASGYSSASAGYNCVNVPLDPVGVSSHETEMDVAIFGVYPNPFNDQFTVQYYVFREANIRVTIVNSIGQVVYTDEVDNAVKGLNYMQLKADGLDAGSYQLVISSEYQLATKGLIKLE